MNDPIFVGDSQLVTPCPGCGNTPGSALFHQWMRQGSGLYLHFEMFADGPDWVACPNRRKSNFAGKEQNQA